MHLAGNVADNLNISAEEKRILRLAGLLHDIGHGPFSHVSEHIIDRSINDSVLKRYNVDKTQELISILLIRQNEEINGILSEEDRNAIISLLQSQKLASISKEIISGPIDVDKIDYLQRDSYFAGVRYGSFDIEKVLSSLIPIESGRYIRKLGIKEEGVYAIEQLLLAKYHMNTQVYRHRIRRITDLMLVRCVEFAIDEKIDEIIRFYNFRDDDTYLNNYVRFNDALLCKTIYDISNDRAKDLLLRIEKRDLFKQIYELELNPLNIENSILLHYALNIDQEQIKEIIRGVSEILKVPEEFIIFDKETIENPTFKNVMAKIDINGIMVKMPNNNIKDFKDISNIFSNVSTAQKNMIYIYAPLDELHSRSMRQSFIESNRANIYSMIMEVLAQ